MSEETKDADIERVREAVRVLCEHFDTAHIFVSRQEEGDDKNTMTIQLGSGNWYARYGQIKSWVIRTDQDTRLEARERDNEP